MLNFKKLIAYMTVAVGLFGYTITASADNFDYADSSQCRAKMYEYTNKAAIRANDFKWGSREWIGFTSLETFSTRMSFDGGARTDCQNGQCTFTTNAGCHVVGTPAWSKVADMLRNELGPYVPNFEKYNPNLGLRTHFLLQCPATGQQPHWDRCTVQRRD